jgi:hypothetical protein
MRTFEEIGRTLFIAILREYSKMSEVELFDKTTQFPENFKGILLEGVEKVKNGTPPIKVVVKDLQFDQLQVLVKLIGGMLRNKKTEINPKAVQKQFSDLAEMTGLTEAEVFFFYATIYLQVILSKI